jgi:hypothetical protein
MDNYEMLCNRCGLQVRMTRPAVQGGFTLSLTGFLRNDPEPGFFVVENRIGDQVRFGSDQIRGFPIAGTDGIYTIELR